MPPPWNLVLDRLRKLADAENAPDLGDADLLELFRAGRDEAAFTLLVQRHGLMVLGVCRRLLGNCHDAEDAFQATFLVLAKKAGSVRKQSSLASWLHGVAYRVATKARARSARRRLVEREAPPPMPTPEASDELTRHELRAALDEEVHGLPEKYRRPVVLCCLEGKTHEQAAGELRWPKSSVTARLARARELLQRRLARRGITAPAGLLAAVLAERTAPAAVGAGLTLATVRLAGQVLAGNVAAGPAVALADSVVRGMTMTKWSSVMVLVLTAGLAAGVGVLARPREEAKVAGPAAGAAAGKAVAGPRADRQGDPLPAGVLARMGSGRLRHGGFVRSLAFSPDGKSLVSGGDGRVLIWDASTGKLRHRLPFDSWAVVLAFSPGKSVLICIPEDRAGPCRLVDVVTGKEIKRFDLDAPVSRPARIALSPDGKLLAVGQQPDRIVRICDAATGKTRLRIRARGLGYHLAFAPGGKAIALADESDTVWLHDTATGKVAGKVKREGARFAEMAFSPDGRSLATTYVAGDGVSIWDLATGKERHRLKGIPEVRICAFSPDGKLLAVGGAEREVRLWDPGTGKEVRRLAVGAATSRLAFTPDGKTLAASSEAITLWDLGTGRRLPQSAYPAGPVMQLCFSRSGKRLIGAAEDILTWDPATGRELRRSRRLGGWPVLSPDGTLHAYPNADGTILLRDAATGKRLRAFKGPGKAVWSLAFSPDGRRLVADDEEGRIRVWDVAGGKELRRLRGPRRYMTPLAVSADGRWLAAGSSDPGGEGALVWLWDLSAGREARHFRARRGNVIPLVFSADGRRLAAAGGRAGQDTDPGGVQVWDLATGQEWRSFDAHKGAIFCAAFSPDGRVLATGGTDRTVRLWELATGRERHRFTGHDGNVLRVAFSPEGRSLAASSPDAPVYVWDVRGALEKHAKLSAAELERCWTDLAGEDAAVAFRAMRRLAADPERALPFLRGRLKPVRPADPARVRRLLAKLDHEDYDVRQKAAAELGKLADAARPALRRAARGAPLEVAVALRRILARLDAGDAGQRRAARAAEVVEWVGTPEAGRLLGEWAAGAPGARLTRESAAGRERLRKR